MNTTTEDHAKANALAWMDNIREMVKAYQDAVETPVCDGGGDLATQDAEDTIHHSVLCHEVRSLWYTPGDRTTDDGVPPGEYRITLSYGGPACQIWGRLDKHLEPETAFLQYQDWGTPWTDAPKQDGDTDVLLTFCRCFYFGE